MRKNLLRKMFASSLALAVLSGVAQVRYVKANESDGIIDIESGKHDTICGYKETQGEASLSGVYVHIGGTAEVKNIYGVSWSGTGDGSKIYNNNVVIDGNARILGNGYGYGGIYGVSQPTYNKPNAENYNNTVTIKGNATLVDGSIYGAEGNSHNNTVNIEENAVLQGNGIVAGAYSVHYAIRENVVNISGGQVNIDVYGGEATGSAGDCTGNVVNISGGSVSGDERWVVGGVGYYYEPLITDETYRNITDNKVVISGGSVEGAIFGGYGYSSNTKIICNLTGNQVVLQGTGDVSKAELYGSNEAINGENVKDNSLLIDGWSGTALGAYNFSSIDMQNISWQSGGSVLTLTGSAEDLAGSLADTQINLNSVSFSGGAELQAGDSMTLVTSASGADLGLAQENVKVSDTFTAGVAAVGAGAAVVDSGKVSYTITEVTVNKQLNLVAENRAVAAAFVNQGSDLIADGLDNLTADAHYGVKTFAAVYGNRSKYDVNSDLKINGWSGLFGVGASKELRGGDLSWGLFFENGSGNYRTFNSFNDDFFRGDGSLVYNGGGAMLRYEQDNGAYTEASLRAGMLKSEMQNALRDGAGNSYGYKSETAYYGAHVGAGKIYKLNDANALDVYCKFFHVYNESDSFTVADDKFAFDSVTSDRLQIGARLTTQERSKWQAYYGLAWEYEFDGEARMRAQNLSAPTQSLQGSTYIGELGVRYAPGKDSPWSVDARVRGYAGEREGFSGSVQATYSF